MERYFWNELNDSASSCRLTFPLRGAIGRKRSLLGYLSFGLLENYTGIISMSREYDGRFGQLHLLSSFGQAVIFDGACSGKESCFLCINDVSSCTGFFGAGSKLWARGACKGNIGKTQNYDLLETGRIMHESLVVVRVRDFLAPLPLPLAISKMLPTHLHSPAIHPVVYTYTNRHRCCTSMHTGDAEIERQGGQTGLRSRKESWSICRSTVLVFGG